MASDREEWVRFFIAAEEGTQSMEVLLIVTFTIVPALAAILLLQEVLLEYLEVATLVTTSPFF